MQLVVDPAFAALRSDLAGGSARLHQVFGANLFLAHAIDYVLAIRIADGIAGGRAKLVKTFDEIFSVAGARIGNRKFELIDAINNSLKHIELDPVRYDDLRQRYGQLTFRSLVEEDGLVLCILEGFRFDYARVVLRPAYAALSGLDHESAEDVLEFARGRGVEDSWSVADELMFSSDPADAIDQMIMACNPECEDCGEREDTCRCAQFKYDGTAGRFEPLVHDRFDFDTVMSRISGAYRPDRE
ncbi:hypothetical protein PSQ39_01880 [Curvibacter sp. HBC28]|uniref:Uncharacterized protein n=1 Tax=Curvibacter microcysteis TaxID=3026419 RepID=A0ABT5MAE7_9BURK|nr:hypothetical protein [Curvibacter sp. HBC28]MDD0813370.1 hypothetical protein [Curvibacter sp. HBC28]